MRRSKNILVITYWSYGDALIQAYTLPYVRMMAREVAPEGKVYLVTLDREGALPRSSPPPGDGIVHISFAYKRFGVRGAVMLMGLLWRLIRLIRTERIDVLHAWCTPGGAVGYLLAKLTGKPLVVDSYEPHAEAMVENGTWKKESIAFRTLFRLEKAQTHHASYLIAAAAGMKQYALEKYGFTGEIFVKPAGVDMEMFSEAHIKDPALIKQLGLEGKLVAVYAGKFGGIYLEQEVFDFFRIAKDHWGKRFHVLLLTSEPQTRLSEMIQDAGMDEEDFTITFVPHHDVPRYMGLADMAITPVRPVPTKRYCTPIKNGEYWSLGLPVVITEGISDDSDIIRTERIGSVLAGLDRSSYKRSVLEIDALLSGSCREELASKIRAVAARYRSFGKAAEIYRTIYGSKE